MAYLIKPFIPGNYLGFLIFKPFIKIERRSTDARTISGTFAARLLVERFPAVLQLPHLIHQKNQNSKIASFIINISIHIF